MVVHRFAARFPATGNSGLGREQPIDALVSPADCENFLHGRRVRRVFNVEVFHDPGRLSRIMKVGRFFDLAPTNRPRVCSQEELSFAARAAKTRLWPGLACQVDGRCVS
jgi:hypothetical protein